MKTQSLLSIMLILTVVCLPLPSAFAQSVDLRAPQFGEIIYENVGGHEKDVVKYVINLRQDGSMPPHTAIHSVTVQDLRATWLENVNFALIKATPEYFINFFTELEQTVCGELHVPVDETLTAYQVTILPEHPKASENDDISETYFVYQDPHSDLIDYTVSFTEDTTMTSTYTSYTPFVSKPEPICFQLKDGMKWLRLIIKVAEYERYLDADGVEKQRIQRIYTEVRYLVMGVSPLTPWYEINNAIDNKISLLKSEIDAKFKQFFGWCMWLTRMVNANKAAINSLK